MIDTQKIQPLVGLVIGCISLFASHSVLAFSGGGDFVGKGICGGSYQIVREDSVGGASNCVVAAEEQSSGGGSTGGSGGSGGSGGGGSGGGGSSGGEESQRAVGSVDTVQAVAVESSEGESVAVERAVGTVGEVGQSDTFVATYAAPQLPSFAPKRNTFANPASTVNFALSAQLLQNSYSANVAADTFGERGVAPSNHFALVDKQQYDPSHLIGYLIESQSEALLNQSNKNILYIIINNVILIAFAVLIIFYRDRNKDVQTQRKKSKPRKTRSKKTT